MAKLPPARPEAVTLVASIFLLAAFNLPLFRHLASLVEQTGGWLIPGIFLAIVLFIFNLILNLLATRWTLKPLLITLLLLSAGATYFMQEYGILIDVGMLRNVIETDVGEVKGLLSLEFFGYLIILGVIPSVLLWRLPIRYRDLPRAALSKFIVTVSSVAVIGLLAISNYQGISSLLRNHHELRLMIVPSNVIGAAMAYAGEQAVTAHRPFEHVAMDARLGAGWGKHTRKSLTVLVVGESVRADNLGVLGYNRDTTPELAKVEGLLAFTNVHSCGTETAVSVPCMFSNMTRKGYSAGAAANREGLLDVLKRAGLDVIWLDNQSGCKGTCARVGYTNLNNSPDATYCNDGECHDEILLRDLPKLLDNLQRDTVLVLHQMGSHGPEYFKRVPAGFDHFQPICRSNALNNCTQEQIVNAYDNTIRYTDHVLARLITMLDNSKGNDTALLYLADHGESLGEYNLYLHGTPYLIAPEQQKHVPLLAWFSEGYRQDFGVDVSCLEASEDRPLSHDNLFHSMLGLLQVSTDEYHADLDLFSACRK